MLDKKMFDDILDTALMRGGNFGEIFLERKEATVIGCEADKIERVSSGLDAGAGIRVNAGDNTFYAYTNDLSREGLMRIARAVADSVVNGQSEIVRDRCCPKPVGEQVIKLRPDAVEVGAKVDLVWRANRTARGEDERIVQVTVSYGDVIQKVFIRNSEGLYVEDERVRTRFIVNVVALERGMIQTGYEAAGGFCGLELFEGKLTEELANKAASRALQLLSAKNAPTGKMVVVMASEAGGTMVHEACGHGLEADLIQKKLSVYADKIGEKVASDLVTVVDDATLTGKYGSYRFDDEGVAGQKTVLIENGILREYMYDRLCALREGRKSTGNGRRESYQDRPIPRMTNTYIAPGEHEPETIIQETRKGLLVKKMGGGQVNTTNGDFVFDVAEGYLIENGKVGPLVRGATLTGNGPRVLGIVDMVGNDQGFAIGTCGKDGQGVPVSDAQPTIRIPELVVGGVLVD